MYAVVPVKAFSQGKQRLSPMLTGVERANLSEAMCRDVLQAMRASGVIDRLILLGADTGLATLAQHFDAELILEQQLGTSDLNDALNCLAVHLAEADNSGRSLLIAHSDLPLLSGDDIRQVANRMKRGQLLMAPDRHGRGTNLLARQLSTDFAVSFGDDSGCRHRQQAAQRQLALEELALPGTGWDIDYPDDLYDALQRFALADFGEHSRHYLQQSGIAERSLPPSHAQQCIA